MKVLSCAALVLAVVVAGCGGTSSTPTRTGSTSAAASAVVVTRHNNGLPAACRPGRVGKRLIAFANAMDTNSVAELKRFWGRGFRWFSVTVGRRHEKRRHFAAFDQRRALGYADRRRSFPLRLAEVEINSYDRHPSEAHLGYQGTWVSASHLRAVIGKGVISCTDPTIRVWSMGVAPPGESNSGPFCPKPKGRSPKQAVISCA